MKNINDYLNNQLSAEEDEKVTQMLFKERFGTSENNSREARWAGIVSDKYGVTRQTKPSVIVKNNRFLLYAALLAAACVAAWVFITVPMQKIPYEQQLQAYLSDWEPDGIGRKGGTLDLKELEQLARIAFNDQRFKEAAKRWAELEKQNPNESRYKFYYARSLFYHQPSEYDRCILVFQQILADNSEWYKQEARWYLSLGLLAQDRNVEATSYLQHIVTAQEWKKEEAAILLEYLK